MKLDEFLMSNFYGETFTQITVSMYEEETT